MKLKSWLPFVAHFDNWKKVFAGMIIISVLFRFFSFFPTVINTDESTYLVIAQGLVNGNLYFVDYIDTKPIGIFLWFALAIKLFGQSIFAMRLMTAIVVGISAFFLYLIKRRLGSDKTSAVAAGLIYISFTSLFTFFGISPNTEHFFNLFTLGGLFLLLNPGSGWKNYSISGFVLGLGLLIKYNVVFDGLAFGLFLIWNNSRNKIPLRQTFGNLLLVGLGAVVPFSIYVLYYFGIGELDKLMYYTFDTLGRYSESRSIIDRLLYFSDFFGRFFPFTILFFVVLIAGKATSTETRMLAITWFLADILVIFLLGKPFGHYFIQLMLPVSFLAADFFSDQYRRPAWFVNTFGAWRVYIWLFTFLIINTSFQYNDYFAKEDLGNEIFTYLEDKLEEGDVLYTGNTHNILYYLLNMEPPTPYVHNSLLWLDAHLNTFQLDHKEELDNIFAQAPKYVLFEYNDKLDTDLFTNIKAIIKRDYIIDKIFRDGVILYVKT